MKSMLKVGALVAVGCAILTGCTSIKESWAKATEPPPPDTRDPMTKWVEDRSFADVIAQKGASNITAEDVRLKLDVNYPALTAVAQSSSELYAAVVKGVEFLRVQGNGRQVYIGVQNDIKAGADAKKLLASMPEADRKAYEEYAKVVGDMDQEKQIALADQINSKQLEYYALVVNLVKQGRDDAKKLKKMEKYVFIAALTAASTDLLGQMGDISTGTTLWKELLEKDKEAKAFMADYPVDE